MKNIFIFLIGLLILTAFYTSCKKKHVKEYYIVSTNDSTDFSNEHSTYDTTLQIKPNDPRCLVEGAYFYSSLVIVFDSTDFVYLYQTDNFINKNSKIVIPRGCVKDYSDEYYKFMKHPVFIGLRPEHLVKLESMNFINFIKNNNDVFHLDTTSDIFKYIFVASNKDTIMNPAFYDLMNLILTKGETYSKLCCMIRITTEEENNVIYCKKNNLKYNPVNINWSKNFLNGAYSPLSKEYDSIEKTIIPDFRKARTTFKK